MTVRVSNRAKQIFRKFRIKPLEWDIKPATQNMDKSTHIEIISLFNVSDFVIVNNTLLSFDMTL